MTSNTYGRIQGSHNPGLNQQNTGYGVSYGHGSHASHGGHSMHQNHGSSGANQHQNQNDQSYINSIPPEDYLEKQNVNGYLRDAVSSLLENRPANPILFMAEHFRRIQQSQPQYAAANMVTTPNGQQVNVLNSNILKAYRLITLNKYDAKSFSDNVFTAYTMIEKDHTPANSNPNLLNNSGIKGNDLIKLTQMLCVEWPAEVLSGILKIVDKREEENVDFEEFLTAIKTIMLYDTYFEEMHVLFKYLDVKGQGRVNKDHLIEAVAKLRQSQEKAAQEQASGTSVAAINGVDKGCELRVPSEDDIDSIYTSMNVTEEGLLNYEEYQIVLFRVTMEE